MAKKNTLEVIERLNEPTLNDFIVKSRELAELENQLKAKRLEVEEIVYEQFNKVGLKRLDKPDNFILKADLGQIECMLQKRKVTSPLKDADLEFVQDCGISHTTLYSEPSFSISKEVSRELSNSPVLISQLEQIIRNHFVQQSISIPTEMISEDKMSAKIVTTEETIGDVYRWAGSIDGISFQDITSGLKRVSQLALTPAQTMVAVDE